MGKKEGGGCTESEVVDSAVDCGACDPEGLSVVLDASVAELALSDVELGSPVELAPSAPAVAAI